MTDTVIKKQEEMTDEEAIIAGEVIVAEEDATIQEGILLDHIRIPVLLIVH